MFRKLFVVAFAAAFAAAPLPVLAQGKKDSVVMGMTLEPPGLDPTNAAAAAIAEVTLYNIFETLTKINEDGSTSPLLAESWTASPDLKTYTFKLRKGVKFHNGEPFDSAAVKFSFERNAVATSTNKDKSLFQSFESIATPDADTVVITLKNAEPNFPFLMGQASASIVEPKSAPTNVTQPVGTGPYQLGAWAKGSSITLNKWADYRNASAIKLSKVTIRFISDPAAQAAALLSGDVDAFPRIATRVVAQFKADPRFTVLIGGSKAKTIVAINHRKKPLDDVRVRRAILAAIDRKAIIEGAVEGFGTPIGSFYTPGSLGYVDTTGINPYDPEKAKKLLAEAGITAPIELSLKLPPPPYARQGGEIVAASLPRSASSPRSRTSNGRNGCRRCSRPTARTISTSPSSAMSSRSTSSRSPSPTITSATTTTPSTRCTSRSWRPRMTRRVPNFSATPSACWQPTQSPPIYSSRNGPPSSARS